MLDSARLGWLLRRNAVVMLVSQGGDVNKAKEGIYAQLVQLCA